jgi:hypothetical protein
MRVIFTGSRKWTGVYGEARVGEVLINLEAFAAIINSPLIIVHGNYHEGLDAIVDRWAVRRGYEPERFDAKWEEFSRAAGPIRNQEMVDAGADMCLGFPLPGGRGTPDCMNRARLAGIPTFTVTWDRTEPTEQLLPQQLKAA